MRAVFLDAGTVDAGDVDLSPLQRAAGPWDWHRATTAAELPQRLATAVTTTSTWPPPRRAA
jgi:hypothetical protein